MVASLTKSKVTQSVIINAFICNRCADSAKVTDVPDLGPLLVVEFMSKRTTFLRTFWRSAENTIKLITFSANWSTKFYFLTTWACWFTHFLIRSQKELKLMFFKTLSFMFELFLFFLSCRNELATLVVFLEFLNLRKDSWAHGGIEGTSKVDRWSLDRFDKEGFFRTLERTSVLHDFPMVQNRLWHGPQH